MKQGAPREWALSSVVVVIIFGSVSCFDHCTVPCRTKTQTYKHTMCLYPKETPGALCRSFEASKELTSEDKELLVKLHNKLRSKVAEGKERRGSPGPQPPAANMMELVWDKNLETTARRWALQCDYKHDLCRQTKDREPVGQNLAISYDSAGFKNDLEKMVTAWYDEVEHTPSKLVQAYSPLAVSETIGHYTQLVWAKTTSIGCARVYFDFSDWGMTEYLVCNYAQGGNMDRAPLYQIGQHCSACSSAQCSLAYPGLCGAGPGTKKLADTSDPPQPDDKRSKYPEVTSYYDNAAAIKGDVWSTILSSILTILSMKFL